MISILIDGKKVDAREGQMLIDVADTHSVDIPRFCYHSKLSVAANCRMCLVEVKGAKKPMPACATPVSEGMIVNTKSPAARTAQKSVMEFLLINHPLDCPICDQGGECELQDVSLEFGSDASRYSANKRVVPEKNIGPLIHTDLTRCIHCTRCVRFGQEIGGIQELGMTRRGEYSEIGTFLEHSVDSELSGNMIDLCPVGALTSKPFRYSARPWELVARESIAAHDSAGSHCIYHCKGSVIKRVVPKQNEEINEVWLSDRDRFGYEGLQSPERILNPMVKEGSNWKKTDWESALNLTCKIFKNLPFNALVNPNATLEELTLLKKIAFHKEGGLDTRIRQRDLEAVGAGVSLPMSAFEKCDAALVVGCALTEEHPMVAHRLRKGRASLLVLDAIEHDFRIKETTNAIRRPALWVTFFAEMAKYLLEKDDERIAELGLEEMKVGEQAKSYAQALKESDDGIIVLGNRAQQSSDFGDVESWAHLLASLTGTVLQILPESTNTIAAKQLGCAPFKVNVTQMLESKAIVLYDVDPNNDTVYSGMLNDCLPKMKVIAFSNFRSEALEKYADVILPISTYAETSGTFINMNGKAQSFSAIVPPIGDSKQGWKVLRVLANLFDVPNCDYTNSTQVRDEALNELDHSEILPKNPSKFEKNNTNGQIDGVIYWHAYALDATLRHASALQETRTARVGMKCQINPSDAENLGFGNEIEFEKDGVTTHVGADMNERVAAGSFLIPAHAASSFHNLRINGIRII